MNIEKILFENQDLKYRDFHSKLIYTINKDTIIGVRVPILRKLGKQLIKESGFNDFLIELPHKYYEENMLHALCINEINNYDICIKNIKEFLPYIDNWAVCDSLSPKILKKHKNELLVEIKEWINSKHIYTVRFGIHMLMLHFLEDDFKLIYAEWVSDILTEDYYVKMMISWYFATALAKQYDSILPFITEKRLDTWIHNKTIQKAVESYRITPEQKKLLKTYRI